VIEDTSAPYRVLRDGPLPLYYQLQEAIRERVHSGEWAPGDQIPTIRELCAMYGVSRITVVQALNTLALEGLLTRQQGKGVFVAQPKIEQGPVRLVSFTEDTSRRGHTASSTVLGLERIAAPGEIATRLELEPGASVVVLERLRLADGRPMGLQKAYLPDRYFPGLAETVEPIQSLYRLLQVRYGVVPTQATDTYEPTTVDRATARLLGVQPGVPAFSVERITRDQRSRVIEFVVSVLRGDRYKVVLKLERL
jgi:GntR family transcriptional regulator